MQVEVVGSGTSDKLSVNSQQNGFLATVAVSRSAGATGTWSIEYLFGTNAIGEEIWITDAVYNAQTAGNFYGIATPVLAIRIVTAAATGTTTLTVLQGG